MIVRRNSPGNPAPPTCYHLRLGQTTQDDAWVPLEDGAGMMGYHLRCEGGQWVVIFAERPVLT
jgi:hypothetical protein